MANDHFGYIGNRRIPYPNREYIESFENLAGGMNTMIRPVQLGGNESPFMQNMSWRNGALGCRRGQVAKKTVRTVDGRVKCCAPFLFHGWMLQWVEDYRADPPRSRAFIHAIKVQQTGEAETEQARWSFISELAQTRQSEFHPNVVFFQYRDMVYVKTVGFYGRVSWSPTDDSISLTVLAAFGEGFIENGVYVPVVQQNTNPVDGVGYQKQQENRLTSYKTIEYNTPQGGAPNGQYHLPAAYIGAIDIHVSIDGNPISATGHDGVDYLYDQTTGVITFQTNPPPPSEGQNNVAFTFSKENPQAIGSLLESTTAIVYGGTQELCVVMGGPDAQPNAYFWSGLGKGDAMDPTYFPMNHYNLAGEVNAPITAFGKQQNMLVIFQPNAVGRAVFGIETIGGTSEETGEATITMNYTRINAEIGCDLPGSLQLVENNLVWCNRKYGVCRLKDSSAAYENNIVVLSRKINNKGESGFPGLLDEFKPGADGVVAPADYSARSVDTGTRYILITSNGHAYEWNYEISEWGNPSWFFHMSIGGVGFVPLENDTLFEVTQDGVVADFEDGVFYDKISYVNNVLTETPIDKEFWFPPRFLGGYDRLKNIMSAIFNTKSETDQNTTITYICDYSHRNDPTNIEVTAPTGTPTGQPYATISRRKPGYHNIRHLQIGLSNNEAGKDMNILSAYIYYTYRGRQR